MSSIVTNNWLTIVGLLDYYYLGTQDKLICGTENLCIMHYAALNLEYIPVLNSSI
jgi:hypothetical protein